MGTRLPLGKHTDGTAHVFGTPVPMGGQIRFQMILEGSVEQNEPIVDQRIVDPNRQVCGGDSVAVIPIALATQADPPEMAQAGFMLGPILDALEGLGQSGMALYAIVEIIHDAMDALEPDSGVCVALAHGRMLHPVKI